MSVSGLPAAAPAAKRGLPAWAWVLLGLGGLMLFGFASCTGVLFYIGSMGPDTSVYVGQSVPERFVEILESDGLLDPGEPLLFFYSDALVDIRKSFSFVTDQKVVVYSEDTHPGKATVLPFGRIEQAELFRNTSFITDSSITLHIEGGTMLAFPVSSEYDRDVQFFEAIQNRIELPSGDEAEEAFQRQARLRTADDRSGL